MNKLHSFSVQFSQDSPLRKLILKARSYDAICTIRLLYCPAETKKMIYESVTGFYLGFFVWGGGGGGGEVDPKKISGAMQR